MLPNFKGRNAKKQLKREAGLMWVVRNRNSARIRWLENKNGKSKPQLGQRSEKRPKLRV